MNNAIIHVKNAMDLFRINALNAIQHNMKIYSKKIIILLSNVFQINNLVKIFLMFMLKLMTIAKIKINDFHNVIIIQSLIINLKFVYIAFNLLKIVKFAKMLHIALIAKKIIF